MTKIRFYGQIGWLLFAALFAIVSNKDPILAATITPTPLPSPYSIISAANINRLNTVHVLGIGVTNHAIWSPDGKTITISTWAGLLQYDFSNLNMPPRVLPTPTNANIILYSGDGRLMATTDSAGSVYLWNLQNKQIKLLYQDDTNSINALAFSPDNNILALGGQDSSIQLWDTRTAKLVNSWLDNYSAAVTALAFAPDGTMLVSGDADGSVALLGSYYGQLLLQLTVPALLTSIATITFSHDGSLLGVGGADKKVYMWRFTTSQKSHPTITTTQQIGVLSGHSDAIEALSFSPDDKYVASGSNDATVRVWSIAAQNTIASIQFGGAVKSVAFSPDGKWLLANGDDQIIKLWSVGDQTTTAINSFATAFESLAFSPDGQTLIAGGANGTLWAWDSHSGKLQTKWAVTDKGGITSLAYSPDGLLIAAASDDQTITFWNSRNGANVRTLNGHTDAVERVAFSPDGKHLASASKDKTVRVWDVVTGAVVATLHDFTDIVYTVAFSPDGTLLAAGGQDGLLRLWDTSSWQLARMFPALQGTFAVDFSPDGSQLMSVGSNNILHVWNIKQTPGTFGAQTALGNSDRGLAVSPDGHLLAFSDSDNAGPVIRIVTDRQPTSDQSSVLLHGHAESVDGIVFSPDGRLLASTSEDGTVRIWAVAARPTAGNALFVPQEADNK